MRSLIRTLLPARMRATVWNLWWRYVKWPVPLWRVRGRGTIQIAGQDVTFVGLDKERHREWVQGARLNIDEPQVTALLAGSLKPGDVYLDVGSYIGGYALLASKLVGSAGRVYAFEPDPTGREVLMSNLRANDAANVEVVASAVAGHVGTVAFEGDGTTVSKITGPSGDTPCTTLDAFCAERQISPSVVKVDIEGGEALALLPAACRRTLSTARVVVVEIHAGVAYQPIADAADACGMQVHALDVRNQSTYHVALLPLASRDS